MELCRTSLKELYLVNREVRLPGKYITYIFVTVIQNILKLVSLEWRVPNIKVDLIVSVSTDKKFYNAPLPANFFSFQDWG